MLFNFFSKIAWSLAVVWDLQCLKCHEDNNEYLYIGQRSRSRSNETFLFELVRKKIKQEL